MSKTSFRMFRILFLGLILLIETAAVSGVDLYVSPDGPAASLAEARDAIRQLMAEGGLTEPVTVHIAEGNYFLSEPSERKMAEAICRFQPFKGDRKGGLFITNSHRYSYYYQDWLKRQFKEM